KSLSPIIPEADRIDTAPAGDHAVISGVESCDLQLDVVLVGPEPWPRFIGPCRTEHVFGHDFRLIYGIADAFKPDPPALMREGGTVPRGPDRGVGTAAKGIGADAVVDAQSSLFGKAGQRRNADADNDEIDRQGAAVGQHRSLDAGLAGQPLEPGVLDDRDAVVAMQGAETGSGLGRSDPL